MKRKIYEIKHKIVGRQILYLNGDVWLVRETCKNNKLAKAKFKELKDLKKLKE